MLRVLQVIGKMDRAGAETMIMNLYRNVDRSKLQFDFLVFSQEQGDYDAEIEAMGGKIFRLPALRGYNYFELYRLIQIFFAEHPYKIVHGHIGSLAPLYLKIAKKHGSYTIAHSHTVNSNRFLHRIVFGVLSHPVRYVAEYFFACSKQAGVDRFGKKVVESKNFQILNNSIESEKYKFSSVRHTLLKKKYKLEDKLVFGHVGRFVPEKNHAFLIEVFEELVKREENVVLLLIGKGPERKSIETLVREKGLEDKVMFMGMRDDIPDMLNLMDAFIFPSYYEGLGIVGIEAQAAGLPCFFSEGIPDEAIVTQNVWKYSTGLEAAVWAENIMCQMEVFQRADTNGQIRKSGFDIFETAQRMQQFYLDKEKECTSKNE